MRSFILAFLFLITPAHAGKSDLPKTPACVAGAPVKVVEETVWVFVPVPLNIFAAREMVREYRADNPRCKMPGRVWHEGKCWLPSRVPK